MRIQGTVREWSDEDGWGVIDAAETPGGCWSHYSAVVMDGYHQLVPGQIVTLEYEMADQDGYDFRATIVWPPGVAPGTEPTASPTTDSAGYRGRLFVNGREIGG